MLWLAEIGVAPTRIRSDWGGEFVSAVQGGFLRTCLERGIWPEKSAPYNAPQNGKAERGNRLLLEMARSMLLHAGLGKEYWGYAIQYACQIDMHCISSRTNKTPHERWYGFDAEWDPPVFGARLFFRHNERGTDKLDPTGHEGIFLGFPTNTPGYIVQDINLPKKPIRITYDVPNISIDENIGTQEGPLMLTKEEYELTPGELEKEKKRKEMEQGEAEPLIAEDKQEVSHDSMSYWHSMQKFALERREALHETMTPEELEKHILKEWKTMQLGKANMMKQVLEKESQVQAAQRKARKLAKQDET